MTSIKKAVDIVLEDITEFFLTIFFPKRCVGCGGYGSHLCSNCAKEIEVCITPVCYECGKITEYGQYCSQCKRKLNTSLDGIMTATKYKEGPVREVIHHLKYSGYTELSEALGELISLRLIRKMPENVVVVPVPLHYKREAERGFNQSELIARYISKKLGIKGGLALKKIRKTDRQATLNRNERLKNLSGVFQCDDKEFIVGKNILLIDDVTTTGATLEECACVLKQSGAKKVYGVVVASARN